MKLLLFFLFFASTIQGLAQRDSVTHYLQIGKQQRAQHQNTLAIGNFYRGLSFCKTQSLDTLRSDLYDNLAAAWGYLGNIDSCASYQAQCQDMVLSIYGKKSIRYAAHLNSYAGLFAGRWQIEKAIAMRLESLRILLEIAPHHQFVPIVCTNLGEMYLTKRDFDRALFYHRKAVEYAQDIKKELRYSVMLYDNLAYSYGAQGKMKEAWRAYNTADSILQWQPTDEDHRINHIEQKANLFYFQGDLDSAAFHCKRHLSELLHLEHPNKSILSASYRQIAWLSLQSNQPDTCIHYAKRSMSIALEIRNGKGSGVTDNYRYLGQAMLKKAQPDDALAYFESSLRTNNYVGKSLDSLLLPQEGFMTFMEISEAYRQKGDLQRRMESLRQADTCLKISYLRLESPSGKLDFLDDSRGFYEHILQDVYQKNRINFPVSDAYYYVEQSKSRMLYSSMKEADALHFSKVPDSIIIQERRLKKELAETDSSSKKILLQAQYTLLIEYINKEYPRYYDLKYNLQTETVASVQRDLLQPGETMLEYFTGDSTIFVFVIQKDRCNVVEIPRDFPLEAWVRDMRSGIMDWYVQRAGIQVCRQRYAQAAHALFLKLVLPLDAFIPQGDRIIVIPDGILAYVPFEALLREYLVQDNRMTRYKYWILEHDISYCYSATLLREMRERKSAGNAKYTFLGMAPTYAGAKPLAPSSYLSVPERKGHTALKYNDQEVLAIQKIMGGQVFTGKDATKRLFCDTAQYFRIVHTAQHSAADDRNGDYSYLAFFEAPEDSIGSEWLYVREVYNLRLHADMIVLSACQTGLGQIRNGEGIIGLTRAFTYAGAHSIVTALWSVDDAWTKELMTLFYQNLKNGQRKDVALANAKRSFILDGGDGRENPLFWAGFIGVGDMGPF